MATPPDFTAGQVLTAAQMDAVGMWLVKSQNFSAADPLDITSVFTSDFRNYKCYLQYYGSSASNTNLQFFTGTNTIYNSATYYRYGFYLPTAGGIANFYAATQTEAFITNHGTTSTVTSPVEITFFSPQATDSRTQLFVRSYDAQGGLFIDLMHQVDSTNAFTGFRLDAAAGSISGKIRVYGIRD